MDNIISVSGSIKALEKEFLTADELARAVQSGSFGEFAAALADSRYKLPQNPSKAEELADLFEEFTAQLAGEMRRNLPEDMCRYFLLDYDYHNIGLIARKDSSTTEREKNYAIHSSVDFFTLKASVENNNYKDIPEYLKGVLRFVHDNMGAEDLLFSLRKMYYGIAAGLLEGYRSDFIWKYLQVEIDFANIATFIQQGISGAVSGKSFFIDGGQIRIERFIEENVLWEAVSRTYRKTSVPVTAESYDFARYSAMIDYVKTGRLIPYGIETVFAYFAGRRAELDNVKRLALGKFYGVDPKVLSEWILPPYQYI